MAWAVGSCEPDPEESLLRYLIDLPGAFKSHSGLTLFHHLIGTFRILKRWDAEDDVCRAGLFHSVYSTPAFREGLLATNRRDELVGVIGASAEALVFGFSRLRWGEILGQGEAEVARVPAPLVLVAAANLVEQCGRLVADTSFGARALAPYLLLAPRLPPVPASCMVRVLRSCGVGHEGPV